MSKQSAVKQALALLDKHLGPHPVAPTRVDRPKQEKPLGPKSTGTVEQIKPAKAEQPTKVDVPATEHATPKPSKSVISREYKKRVRSPDWIREELREAQNAYEDGLCRVAKENGLLDRWNNKWAKLNCGMQAMNLGNVLRAMEKRGETVKILGATRTPMNIAA